jgi:hypothetical protein
LEKIRHSKTANNLYPTLNTDWIKTTCSDENKIPTTPAHASDLPYPRGWHRYPRILE